MLRKMQRDIEDLGSQTYGTHGMQPTHMHAATTSAVIYLVGNNQLPYDMCKLIGYNGG